MRVSGVRGPLTPSPGHQPHVRTGWGAPRWTTCCGRALQGFACLRVCSEGAAGLHVTVQGSVSLNWAVVPSTGSCPLQLSRTFKIPICMKTRPIDTFSGTSVVWAHMCTHGIHAYAHTCAHTWMHTHRAQTHRSPTSTFFSAYLSAKFMVILPDPEGSSSISFALPHFPNHLITSVFWMAIITG